MEKLDMQRLYMKKSVFRKYITWVISYVLVACLSFISYSPLMSVAEEAEQQITTGSYSIDAGWSMDDGSSTQEATVYKQDTYMEEENTSSITCSYLDTSYSVFEYEQLREMLANNLLYSNVNAQISASAVYTDAKDYLYILTVDDPTKDYRNIYHYIVGDYRCFCVNVKEVRSEAEELKAEGQKTPQETGKGIAEKFTWN